MIKMTEAKVGHLFKIASTLAQSEENEVQTLLKSYYLMRCKDLTRGYGLPEKHFSAQARCPHCCLKWRKGTEIKLKPVKLSKRQRQRIKASKPTKINKEYIRKRKELLHSNELEKVCTFCKNSTVTPMLKPEKQVPKKNIPEKVKNNPDKKTKNPTPKILAPVKVKDMKPKPEANVYSSTFDVFSLNNRRNTLASSIKEAPRVIKNNKKKKDKFAGLCQQAVTASAKLKEQKGKQNKLNLFLRPSS